MAKILITGGTGMIGKALTKKLLENGYEVMVLTRKVRPSDSGIVYKEWDVEKGTIDKTAIAEADCIVHLAGANVADGRWTEKRKKEIVDSRVNSGQLLVKALQEIPNNVASLVSASAIGWYGADKEIPNPKPFIETDPADEAFLGKTSREWEGAIWPVADLGKRLVIYRIGIVLSNEGGAYAEFKKPLKFGIASILGNGKQMVSWIHIDDLVQLFLKGIEDRSLQGVYNAVAPNPVSNRELMMTLAKESNKFFIPAPVPSFGLKLALGEMSIEVLKSATVSNHKIQAAGFDFQYQTVGEAVKNLEANS